jgi:hypothetical protein
VVKGTVDPPIATSYMTRECSPVVAVVTLEVVAKALADPAVTGIRGKTPDATLSAALYTEAKKKDGAVILVERGMMKARPQRKG